MFPSGVLKLLVYRINIPKGLWAGQSTDILFWNAHQQQKNPTEYFWREISFLGFCIPERISDAGR